MAARPKLIEVPQPPEPDETTVKFVTSGNHLLDKVLGGGWAQGRIINLVGDRSSGKTLLAIEACANFAVVGGIDQLRYAEAEAAFDAKYARSIGMPDGLKTIELETVEELYSDINTFLDKIDPKKPSLYVLDSLDALTDDAEMERDIDKGSYGASKPKKLSEMFRRIVRKLDEKNCTLFIISQVRDKLNISFGETKTRSGGRALDFYASQIVWLAEVQKTKRTVLGVERITGVWVNVRTKKNKVGPPFRSADIYIQFNFGVLDGASMVAWLKKHKVPGVDYESFQDRVTAAMRQTDRSVLTIIEDELKLLVSERWERIENELKPTLKKY